VFELPSPLENASVVIKANGTPIGRGELVAVGDTLGVQLLTIDTRGFR
jgi:type III secretion protein Q